MFDKAIKYPSNKTKDLEFAVHSVIKCHKCCTQKTIDEFRNKFLPLAQEALDRQSESYSQLDTSNYGDGVRPQIANFLRCLSEATDHYSFVRLQKVHGAGGYGGYHDYKKKLDQNAAKFGYEIRKTRKDLEEQITKEHAAWGELTEEFVKKIDMPYPVKLYFTSFPDSLISIKTMVKGLCERMSLDRTQNKDLRALYDQTLYDHGVLVLSKEQLTKERDAAVAQVSKGDMKIEELTASLKSCNAKLNEIAKLLNLCQSVEPQEIQATFPAQQKKSTMDIETIKTECSVAVGTHWGMGTQKCDYDGDQHLLNQTSSGTFIVKPNKAGGDLDALLADLDEIKRC